MTNKVVTFTAFLKESTYSDWQSLNSLGIADTADLEITAVELRFKGRGFGDLIDNAQRPQFIEFIKEQSLVCVGTTLNRDIQEDSPSCISRWIGPAESIKELASLLTSLESTIKINKLENLSVHTRWWLYAMKRDMYLLSNDENKDLFS